eukprot:CAMPEP_0204634372 /NCGR_PEP_ID=MMETSP0717-20131115/29113_1 /ASSEMBLY_ACC=CAM_ASM_000666 /TAXON_ID=230516 /ORGANISM="Chaetoceros curvisetus" /LENGTH=118 /DNA_ID=CAMNT_0051652787 /DNA_START=36 /DNA_END=388 /DNA_ORIENTATION=+
MAFLCRATTTRAFTVPTNRHGAGIVRASASAFTASITTTTTSRSRRSRCFQSSYDYDDDESSEQLLADKPDVVSTISPTSSSDRGADSNRSVAAAVSETDEICTSTRFDSLLADVGLS